MDIPEDDLAHLIRDKYDGDTTADVSDDARRLAEGEPLAYVIGWIPFLGLKIYLDSRPLIPRPETEWWTEALIEHMKTRFSETPFRLLDLCAGSGAVGLAVLKACPNAQVSFGEISSEHTALIQKNIELNYLDSTRAVIRSGDLYAPFQGESFDIIAANPPYIPTSRSLVKSVIGYEPHEALYSGPDGLGLIRRIAGETPHYIRPGGELWMECDASNAKGAAELLRSSGALEPTIRTDLYGRERLVLAYY